MSPTKLESITSILERIPPQNLEAEQSLLGSVLIDKDAIVKVIDLIQPEDFYKDGHRIIFEAMLDLFNKREPIDILSLVNILEEKKQLEIIGGRSALVALTNVVPTASHVRTYAGIIQKKATLRRLIRASTEIGRVAYNEDQEVDEMLDKAEQELFSVSRKYLKRSFTPIQEALEAAFERIDDLHRNTGQLRGLPTGFVHLDNILSGLQKSDLIIVAARPSVGKTSLALDFARHIGTKRKAAVGIFSLEMSKDQLIDRLLCSEARVDLWRMRTGRLSDREGNDDFAKIGHAIGTLSDSPIYIDDSSSSNIMEIRAKARRLQSEHGLDCLIVDYLQLMEGRGDAEGRVQEVAEITRGLKALARELSIPVVALSQLSRAVESRSPAIPKLSDLRESGCLAGDTLIMRADTGALIPIQKLVGEKNIPVYSLNEKTLQLEVRRMTAVFSSGKKKLFQITLRSGRTVKASTNHPFYTVNGWRRLDQLVQGIKLALPRALQPTSQQAIETNPNTDVLPREVWGTHINQARIAAGLSWRDLSERINTAYCGSTLFKHGVSRERMMRVATAVEDPSLFTLAQSDISWDEVLSITPLGIEEVFDATVPVTHNFVANDILVHNSIEQDADVVMFIYRKAADRSVSEVPPEQKHLAEIHIAKHRNGPTGMVQMYFDEGSVSFRTLENQKRDPLG